MNITRLLGRNNKIYQKFGDYCTTEAEPNQCFIVCCFCQEEHMCEATFWTHMQEVHSYVPAQLSMMSIGNMPTSTCNGEGVNESPMPTPVCHFDPIVLNTTIATNALHPIATDNEPMYVEAAYLEGVQLNDPQALLELNDITRTFFNFKDKNAGEGENVANANNIPEKENVQLVENGETPKKKSLKDAFRKSLDIDKLSPKQLLQNGKLLKSLFKQMQAVNNEFKYKLNKLTQTVQMVENELKKDPASRTYKRYMKIIPDQPFTSRDEVLILDDELHHSKEMRDALLEETLAIGTQNADLFCRLVWRFIMTDEVSNQFCWRGVVNLDKVIKYPVKDMTIMEVLQSAFREKFPGQSLQFFKDRTMSYFNKASDRLKRKQVNKTDGNGSEGSTCDFLINKEDEQTECDFKRACNGIKNVEDDIDTAFEEVFNGRNVIYK
ncbi:uncharacterized protein [Eurosta solidaginis]|uniref:uncharacterized protein n=1 Tax=Eurosta solidaginis TaxID=178769 RepID=UPI0035309ED2